MADERTVKSKAAHVILLAETSDVANSPSVTLKKGGELQIHVKIDNGAGAAPVDNPQGYFRLWASHDADQEFDPVEGADVTEEMVLISPAGNALHGAWAKFEGVPGKYARVSYVATGGGATSARARLWYVT